MKTITFTYLGTKCEYNIQNGNLHIISETSFNSPNQVGTHIVSKKHNIRKKDIKSITFKHHHTKLPSHLYDYFSNYINLKYIELEKLNFKNVKTIDRFIVNCPKLKEITITHKKAKNLTSVKNFITQTEEITSITINHINAPNLKEIDRLLVHIGKNIEQITIEDITAPNIDSIDKLIDTAPIKTLDLTKIGNVNITSIKTLIRNGTKLKTLEMNRLTNTKEIKKLIELTPFLETNMINKINKIEKLDPYFLKMTPKNGVLDLNKFKDISKLTSHLKQNLNEHHEKYKYRAIKIGEHKIKLIDYATILINKIPILDKTEEEIIKEIVKQSKNEKKKNIESFLEVLKNKNIFKNKEYEKQLTTKLTIIKSLK